MAKAFGCIVTAEGVETEQQLAVLQTLDCPRAQGFLFTHPVPAEELPALFASTRVAAARSRRGCLSQPSPSTLATPSTSAHALRERHKRTVGRRRREVVIAPEAHTVHRAAELTGLAAFLPIHATRSAAIASIQPKE